MSKNTQKEIPPETELHLLRNKAQKLESDHAQLMLEHQLALQLVTKLREENRRLMEVSMYSTVCPHLYNKRFFDQEAQRMIELERRFQSGNGRFYGVIYADLNHLKRANAQYGHAGGDRAICAIGSKLMETARRSDIVAHIHGDEFVVMFFANGLIEAYRTYSRISRALKHVEVRLDDVHADTYTVSAITALAIQNIDDPNVSLEDTCHKADLRMLAKKERRDKKELFLQ